MKNEKNARRVHAASNCETCEYFYSYDDTEEESCRADLDEDERYRFMRGATRECPYYRRYDEYRTVRKQI